MRTVCGLKIYHQPAFYRQQMEVFSLTSVKRAVVFSGGGAKGGYQIGAWKALREIGFEPDLVTGTSVGALNGALMALGKYEDARSIWENMSMNRVFSQFVEDTQAQNLPPETLFKRLAREVLRNGGADISPLQELVKSLMDEDALRHSPIRFGLVTTRFSPIKAVELFIEEIPEGEAADYVLASAACFPFMKSYQIGNIKFVDGGYSDNMPVQMAVNAGATEVAVVDISGGLSHQPTLRDDRALIHYIHNKRPFNNGQPGAMLLFDQEISRQNMRQGYLDTCKCFGLLDGSYYSFQKNEKYQTRAQEILCHRKFSQLFSALPSAARFERSGRQNVISHLEKTEEGPFLYRADVLSCAECAAEIFGLDPREIYTFAGMTKQVIDLVHASLMEEHADEIRNFGRVLDRGLSLELLKTAITGWDKRLLTVYAMQILLEGRISEQQRLRIWLIATLMPDVFCAALFCWVSITFEQEKGRIGTAFL